MNKSYERLWDPLMPPASESIDECKVAPKPLPGRDICLREAVEFLAAQDFRDEIDPIDPDDEELHSIGVANDSQLQGEDDFRYDDESGTFYSSHKCQVEGCSMQCTTSLDSRLNESADKPTHVIDPESLDACIRKG